MNKYLLTCLFVISVSLTPAIAQQIGGIGAQLLLDTAGGHTMPQVSGLVKNSAADQNLKATDYIIKVNGISCLDKSLEEVVGMIRGEIGTTVKVIVADTKEGKRPREYDLLRGSIGIASSQSAPPAADPVVVFNTLCEDEVAQLKKSGSTIIKTFPSDCGNYFFNFDTEAGLYHTRVMTLTDQNKDAAEKAFYITARVFDNTNEAGATQVTKYEVKDAGNFKVGRLDGTATFTKAGVGVVNVQLHEDEKKCRAMYVIIYK